MASVKEKICKRCSGTGQMCVRCGKSECDCKCNEDPSVDANGDEIENEFIDCGLCDGRGSVSA